VVLRSRYVEDELDQAIKRGVSQYVILGAGLDSFAYRKRHLVDVLRVFEVDHPATQTWKRERLKAVGVDLPTNLTFVPLDFEKQSLIETLRMKGYRSDTPALFSWLGVVPYRRRKRYSASADGRITHGRDGDHFRLRSLGNLAR
jgi:methyltransferase (TIGR00027 family)